NDNELCHPPPDYFNVVVDKSKFQEQSDGFVNNGFIPDISEHLGLTTPNGMKQRTPSANFNQSDLENGIVCKRDEFMLENDRRNSLKSIRFRLLRVVDADKIREDLFVKTFANT
ncbi:unnamed protein product, partial [Allacma fusca]